MTPTNWDVAGIAAVPLGAVVVVTSLFQLAT